MYELYNIIEGDLSDLPLLYNHTIHVDSDAYRRSLALHLDKIGKVNSYIVKEKEFTFCNTKTKNNVPWLLRYYLSSLGSDKSIDKLDELCRYIYNKHTILPFTTSILGCVLEHYINYLYINKIMTIDTLLDLLIDENLYQYTCAIYKIIGREISNENNHTVYTILDLIVETDIIDIIDRLDYIDLFCHHKEFLRYTIKIHITKGMKDEYKTYSNILYMSYTYRVLNNTINIMIEAGCDLMDVIGLFFNTTEDVPVYHHVIISKLAMKVDLKEVKSTYSTSLHFNTWYNEIVMNQI